MLHLLMVPKGADVEKGTLDHFWSILQQEMCQSEDNIHILCTHQ